MNEKILEILREFLIEERQKNPAINETAISKKIDIPPTTFNRLLNGYYTPPVTPVTTWADLIKMSPDWVLGSVESGEVGEKFHQIPLSYHSLMGREAMMKAGEDGPGNGGGSPSAGMKFYFVFPEEITPERVKQIQEQLAERGGAFIMSPFYGYNMKGYLEDEAVGFEKKRILKGEASQNYRGIVPNEGVQ